MAELPQISFSDDSDFARILHTLPSKTHEQLAPTIDEVVNDVISYTTERASTDTSEDHRAIVADEIEEDTSQHNSLKDVREVDIDDSRFTELILALSKEVEVPQNSFVVVIGARDIKTDIVHGIMKANSFAKHQYQLFDYDGVGFKLSKYFNNPRCIGIILGPEAHKMEGVRASSLKSELTSTPGYPYTVSLIHEHITKSSLQKALIKIKWNYERTKKD